MRRWLKRESGFSRQWFPTRAEVDNPITTEGRY